MIEVNLTHKENFLKIKETLTRMGIANNSEKVLYQSCHIFVKQGKTYIAHFKDLIALDGKHVTISEEDQIRTNSIAMMLEQWGMLTVINRGLPTAANFRILKHSQKAEWTLVPKYKVG